MYIYIYEHVQIYERDVEIPMKLLLVSVHISDKVSQAILAEVIFQIAHFKGPSPEYRITPKAMAFFPDQALKAASSFFALGASSFPSTMSQSC